MEARHLLKQLKDEGWYLGDTAGACRQYVHGKRRGVITVCLRYTDTLGPDSLKSILAPAEPGTAVDSTDIVVEDTGVGYSAYSPDVSGCGATGETEPDVRKRMADALTLHIARIRGS